MSMFFSRIMRFVEWIKRFDAIKWRSINNKPLRSMAPEINSIYPCGLCLGHGGYKPYSFAQVFTRTQSYLNILYDHFSRLKCDFL